jgi:hypothetical protein
VAGRALNVGAVEEQALVRMALLDQILTQPLEEQAYQYRCTQPA